MTSTKRQRLADMLPAQQAGILCNDPRFQRFAATRSGMPGQTFSNTAAAEYLRNCCHIDSRCDLNTSPTAQTKFQILRTEFDAWTGRIAAPTDWETNNMTRAEFCGAVAQAMLPAPKAVQIPTHLKGSTS